jgi:phage anti-repressor protein
MYLDVEGSDFKKSFVTLESVFSSLNIKPKYFPITRNEFTRSIEFKKNSIMRVVENYSGEVISEINDPFLETAIKRGCVEEEDFIRFFDGLLDVPKYFSSQLELSNELTKDVEDAIEKGFSNEALKAEINEAYKRKRNRDKRKNAILHDAGLLSGVAYMRSNDEKCFILSRDHILNEVALGISVRDDAPIAISLDTLINLLAIDNGGTGIDAMNYAPLFANIVKLELVPEKQTFKVEDLAWLLDIQNQISDLPKEEIIDLAKQIHNSQRNGVKDEEISLEINRSFQKAKLTIVNDLDKAKQTASFEREEKEKFIKKSSRATQALREVYTEELKRKYKKSLAINKFLFFIAFPVIMISIVSGIIILNRSENQNIWISHGVNLGINILSWFILDFFFIKNYLNKNYSKKLDEIKKIVDERILNETEN